MENLAFRLTVLQPPRRFALMIFQSFPSLITFHHSRVLPDGRPSLAGGGAGTHLPNQQCPHGWEWSADSPYNPPKK